MAEPTEVQIAETNQGRLVLKGNELLLYDLTSGDPVAIRFRSHNETKGKHSIDAYVNGTWRELGFVGFKADERGRTDPAHRDALEVEFWTHIPGRGFEDADYRRMFSIRHDGATVAVPRVTRFYTDGGTFCVNWQDDTGQPTGIVYRVTGPDESAWVPVGRVRIDPL